MKRLKLNIGSFGILIALVILISACSKDDENDVTTQTTPQLKSIVEIASTDDNYSILVEALSKADLVTALEGNGPFTVFAPTNSAFEMLFETLNVNGIDDLSSETLAPILLYHVVGAKAMSSDLSTSYYETLSNSTPDGKGMVIFADISNGVKINNSSMVTTADIEASNGVVHVIDKVILPPSVVDIAIQNPNFSILVDAVVKAGLVDALSAEGPFTIFAPTNSAFEAAFTALNINGIEDLSAEALVPILTYHVIADNVLASEVSTGMVSTLNSESSISISVSQQGVILDNTANVIITDMQGSNGVIHAIDNVLLPN